jgi:hypothetical protein
VRWHHSLVTSALDGDERPAIPPAALTPKKQPAVVVTSKLYDNSTCRVGTDRLMLLFREIMAVCCGNCRKQISADFVAIRCLMLKC